MNRLAGPILHRFPVAAALMAGTWFLALAATSPAQDREPIERGTHLFRHILEEHGLHSRSNPARSPDRQLREALTELFDDPDQKLLIVLGDVRKIGQYSIDLRRFVRQGGAVLLATDRDAGGNGTTFGARIHGDLVRVRSGSPASYKGTEDCIFIKPIGQGSPFFNNLTLRGKLSRVATNRPGYLTLSPNGKDEQLQVVALFPDDASVDNQPGGPLAFAAAGEWDQGRILVLADHSVFINAMLAQTDNENYEFAENCINWLRDGNRRNEVILLDEGAYQSDFALPLPQLAPPPIESFSMDRLVHAADEAIVGMEEENVFDTLLLGASRSDSEGNDRLSSILVVATLGLAAYALTRLVQARHRFEPGTPLLADGVRQLVSGVNLPQQRQRALLQQGNYWETARSLAREVFGALAAETAAGRIATFPGACPLVVQAMGRWQRRRLGAAVQRLWRLAQSSEPALISVQRLKRLKKDAALVAQAMADGRLASVSPTRSDDFRNPPGTTVNRLSS
jgi:hypothetical protein